MAKAQCLSKDPLLPTRANSLRQEVEQLVGRASDDSVTLKERVDGAIRRGTRATRLSYVRAAGGTDFYRREDGDSTLNIYKNLGFNTVVITDLVPSGGGLTLQLSEEEVEAAVKQARKFNMNILLSIPSNHYSYVPYIGSPTHHVASQPPEVVKEVFAKWMKYDRGDIVGVYFLGDDFYLVDEPVANQIAWRNAIREVSTDVPVLGILGDLSILADPNQIEQSYTQYAFDHVLMLTYGYNLSTHPTFGPQIITKLRTVDPAVVPLNNITSVDPEGDLQRYIHALYSVANTMYFSKLRPGQKVIPVTEAFVYTGATAGTYVRASDIYSAVQIQTVTLADLLHTEDWNPMTYFYWGGIGLGSPGSFVGAPEGIEDHPEWWDTVRLANLYLQKQSCVSTRGGVLARYVLGVK